MHGLKGEGNVNSQEIARLDDILQKHDYNATLLIAIMQDIQKIYHYLPQEVLTYIASPAS